MKLSAKAMKNWANANQFDYGDQWDVRAGDPNTLYFQLVDLDKGGLRYIPGLNGETVGVVVTFPSIDDSQVINITATQDADDGSIFKAVMGSTQKPNSGSVRFAISENNSTRRFNVLNLISVEYPTSDGAC